MRKTHYEKPFSIAILVYQRVIHHTYPIKPYEKPYEKPYLNPSNSQNKWPNLKDLDIWS